MPGPDRPSPVGLGVPLRIHVVGVGGAGMSTIALVLAGMGHRVTGSDRRASRVLDRLADSGITVSVGQDPAAAAAADLVAASTAVAADDPDVVAALAAGRRVLRRAEVLSAICARRRTVAVAGTHGKTTTASMLAVVLTEAGLDPTYVIGGDISGVGPGGRWGGGDWMVVEADESDGTFLEIDAEVRVVTSVEADHLEHFGGLDPLLGAFARFAAGAGTVVLGADDPGAAGLAGAAGSGGAVVSTVGTDPHAVWAINDVRPGRRGVGFAVRRVGEPAVKVDVALPGLHNARNAAAALVAAVATGVDPTVAAAGLSRFAGVGRRFEWRGERGGVTYVDDYGHLPGEVRAALAAAVDGSWGRVVAVFQPHRFSRTEALWRSFADAFDDADVVVVTDVYPSGEAPRPGVSGELVASAVRGAHPGPVIYVPELVDLPGVLDGILVPGDLCLTLGAGDLTGVVGTLVAGRAR